MEEPGYESKINEFNLHEENTLNKHSISAQVYVKNTFTENYLEEIVKINSELMTKEEVLEIGKDNFSTISNVTPLNSDSTEFYRLVISLDIEYAGIYHWDLSGSANWDTSGLWFPGVSAPQSNYDVAGFLWDGNFDYVQGSPQAIAYNNTFNDFQIAPIHEPNAGYVWTLLGALQTGHDETTYMTNADMSIRLGKYELTGGGNTTSFVYQYTHTYSNGSFSVSINPTSPSFSISGGGVDSWDISAQISGVLY